MSGRKVWYSGAWVDVGGGAALAGTTVVTETEFSALSPPDPTKLYAVVPDGSGVSGVMDSFRANAKIGTKLYAGATELWTPTSPAVGGSSVTDIDVSGTAYRVHTFTEGGTLTVQSAGLAIEYLLIAGGGAGGYNGPGTYGDGGGGAGGMLLGSTTLDIDDYPVTVGAGGTPVIYGGSYRKGFDSTFNALTVEGGGAGGLYGNVGMNGGSGGGGSGYNIAGGTGSTGYNGGGSGQRGGGGGGGAGAVGSGGTSSTGGAGGAGASSSITGSAVTYGGGGGGGGNAGAASGGSGGGGGGAGPSSDATNGTANTGGGGGGAYATHPTAGSGGSGIVIVRYVI